MAGTHPTLIEALVPHDAKMKQIIAQADRVRQLQMINVNALFDCEKKQADDENKVRGARACRLALFYSSNGGIRLPDE